MNENVYDALWMNLLKSKAISLDGENIALLKNIFKIKLLKKDMFFLQEGEKYTEIGIIVKGIFRSFYIDKAGNDITKYFYESDVRYRDKQNLTHPKEAAKIIANIIFKRRFKAHEIK